MRRLKTMIALSIGLVAALPGVAQATQLGPWQQITTSAGPNTDEVTLLRTPDQRLHIEWLQPASGGTSNLWHMSMSPNGGLGAAATVVSGWASLEGSALVSGLGGSLDTFVGGIRTTSPGDPFTDMNLLTSDDDGASWTLQNAGDVVAPGAAAYGSAVSVASVGASATPLETWYGTAGVWVHAGTSATAANSNYQTAVGCCGYYSSIVANGAGSATLAWYSNASGHLGVYTATVNPDGTAQTGPTQMPDTANMKVGELQRTPLVSRRQGGSYVAYPTGWPSFTAIKLWKVGSSAATTITALHKIGTSAVASEAVDSAGRVWVFWATDVNDRARVYAARSNPSVTRFGAVVEVGAPARASSDYNIDGNASTGALDLFSTISIGAASTASAWYRHVYPGLSLSVSPANVKAPSDRHDGPKSVSVDAGLTVTDAGVPVKGATVKLGSHVVTTDGSGHADVRLDVGGSLTATASDAGYVDGAARLRYRK